jgi:hypothetical protein
LRNTAIEERAEPIVEASSDFAASEELRQNMITYSRRLQDYKRDHPNFAQYADPATPLPRSEMKFSAWKMRLTLLSF